MDLLTNSTSLHIYLKPLTEQVNVHISTQLALILITVIFIVILTILNNICEPMNYKLDLTRKEFCKYLAEVDNSFGRGERSYLNRGSLNKLSEQQRAVDCATDVLKCVESRSVDSSNNSFSNTNSNNKDATAGDGAIAPTNTTQIYPNGWIPLMESFKVKPASVRKAIIFGRDVIVTRSADGSQVNVLDAYCPHMGVHIGMGGRVCEVNNESCVECPFHGWTFRASDGQCVKIPYQKITTKCSIPKQAKLVAWICAEVDNFIYIWHHADGEAPSWHLNPSTQLSVEGWHLAGRSCHKTNLDLRDMHENGADMNHFEGIHNDLFILGGHFMKIRPLNYLQQYVRHHWLPEWKPLLDDLGKMTHIAKMSLQSWITLFKARTFDITVNATQIGPARVNLYYNSKWYGEGLLTMNAIPLGGRRTKYIQHIYTHKTLFQFFMAKWVLYGEIKMLERDFFIWNHKKNIKNPIFIPEDKTLKQFRMWYSQFYKRKRRITIEDSVSSSFNSSVPDTCKGDLNF